MATAFGPERVMDTAAMNINPLERPSGRHLPSMLSLESASPIQHAADADAAEPSPRNMPPPNPPFVFPARPSSSSAPSSYSRASGRRPRSTIDTTHTFTMDDIDTDASDSSAGRHSALPNFSFNPGGSLPDSTDALLSPPKSPRSPHNISHAPSPSKSGGGHGHRRGGSEFVGGNIRAGESITVMSTSPTKSESGMADPEIEPPKPSGPPPGARRRGHAHRRSAAISSHDLSLILQPPKPNGGLRGSSAPTSPSDFGHQFESPFLPSSPPPVPPLPKLDSEPAKEKTTPEKRPECANDLTPRQFRPVPRARVGFSDTLEFIPRPLSLVSSDGSSTATARPGGHSVSGSLSSIVSEIEIDTYPVRDRETEEIIPLEPSPTRQTTDSRPSTAGAILDRSQSIQSVNHSGSPKRRNSIPHLTMMPDPTSDIPSAEPSPTAKTQKRWSFFGMDPFSGSQSPTTSRPARAVSNESLAKQTDSASVSSEHASDSAPEASEDVDANAAPSEKKQKKKKKKKVKAWAGSILKSKSKPRSKKSQPGTPTQTESPTQDSAPDEGPTATAEEDHDEAAAAYEPPTVILTDSSGSPQIAQSWKPRPTSFDDDTPFPMIDLDAALGPFNTPLPNNPEWEAAQKAAGPSKRQLHSAQGMRGFSGPGMHYHRRAESAPEMVPFEAVRFGINRFGSSSTMADVFEEDEEDDDNKTTSSRPSKQETLTDSTDSDSDDETPPATTVPKPLVLDSPATRHAASMRSERSINSLHDQVIVEEPQRNQVFRPSSSSRPESTGSATPSPRHVLANNDPSSGDVSPLHLPTQSNIPVSPYSMSWGSSFPSPRSPVSYDAQRISTAPSSVNEENNLQSLLLGEPGPEVRLSMDVPPSLTSSNSTMTRDSAWASGGPQPRAQLPFRPDQRPSSVSSAAFGRRRSSLASLSRLISSSHGERSKLSTEVSLEPENEKKQKTSKAKRLSRMMQFWKPSKGDTTT